MIVARNIFLLISMNLLVGGVGHKCVVQNRVQDASATHVLGAKGCTGRESAGAARGTLHCEQITYFFVSL